jgi:hypothetical protein
MPIFKNTVFHEWAIEQKLEDSVLIKIAEEVEQDLYEANLGGGVYKKRAPIAGRGKRGGARVIIAFKLNKITLFMYGFTKKEKDNVTMKEKEALKALAKTYFGYSEEQLEKAVKSGKLIEIAL